MAVAIIALMVFGPRRLPELGKSLGKGMRDFRAALAGEDDEDGPPPTKPELSGSTESASLVGRAAPAADKAPAEER